MLPEKHSENIAVPESLPESSEEAVNAADPTLEEMADLYRVSDTGSSSVATHTELEVNSESSPLHIRSERIKELTIIVKNLEESTEKPDSIDTVRDELFRASILLRSMVEADTLYERAESKFGRQLTDEEEMMMLTTLDYLLRRIITLEVQKNGQADLESTPTEYLNVLRTGDLQVLPGGKDMFVGHDLPHVALALKLGVLNENSPIPTFMKDSVDFNSGKQAMLEEAFATLFTPGIFGTDGNYDDVIKNINKLHQEALSLFDMRSTPFFRGMTKGENPYFTNPVLAKEAMDVVSSFIESNVNKLEDGEFIVLLALFSQGAAYFESLQSASFKSLTEEERLEFIKDHIQMAESNIDTLISGEVPPEADLKYKKTIDITRDTIAKSLESIQENPEKPVFVELLLESLRPLYSKAVAQAQTNYERLASSQVT